MKKVVVAAAALLIASASFVQAKNEFISIDSILIMQKSKEGKELTTQIQQEIEVFQGDVKKAQKELSELQEALNKQAKVLSKEALQEKTEEINNKRKKMEREFADKEEQLRVNIQKKQITLRERQLSVVNEVFEKQEWGAVIDKNTPGLLCISNAIDRTDIVLRAVDEKYSGAKAKKEVTKTVKTASNDKAKPEIKVA